MTRTAAETGDSKSDLLQRFEQEYLQSSDPGAVLERYRALHPESSEALRELAEAVEMLRAVSSSNDAKASRDSWGHHPERLGPYRVVRTIGRGGMGEVFEAVEEPLGRRVAVKTIRRGHATSGSLLVRFDRERRALARLHHSNIVPIFATGKEGDLLYFAMPYIPGASLRQVIKTARSHELSGTGLSSSSFEELIREAHSRARSASPESAAQCQDVPGCAPPGDSEAVPLVAPADLATSRTLPMPGLVLPSKAYIRSAVQVMATVAEGLHHSHQAEVVHRDLKPSNIMVETGGHVWVLDFGLATLKGTARGGPMTQTALDAPSGAGLDSALTVAPVGTPLYMAPEQHRDGTPTDARTDVWGLGVTLYELLTLDRAFPDVEAVSQAEPIPPRVLNPRLDRDLEAIVLRTLRKDPRQRYVTAQALADDLNRWLRHEPVRARPTAIPRRLWLWSRRRPAAAVAALGMLIIGPGGLYLGNRIAAVAQAESVANQRELALQSVQRFINSRHEKGWSDQALTQVSQAVALGTASRSQPLAIATLVGLDAELHREFKDFGARRLSFDPNGRLLMGGVTEPQARQKRLGTRLWDSGALEQPQDLGVASDGPVAFRADGSPVQLMENGQALTLMDLSRGVELRRFDLPGALIPRDEAALTPLAMLSDGSRIAAPLRVEGGKPALIVWDSLTGAVLRRFESESRCAAFSPDGAYVAGGDSKGQVIVWSMGTGLPVAKLNAGNRINVLMFGRNPRFNPNGPGAEPPLRLWQLAAGDGGGNVTVWDLGKAIPSVRSIGRGSYNEVFALSFSPDGALLASAGRHGARIWDPATGSLLLFIAAGQYQYGLTFSPDGGRLAIGSEAEWQHPGCVQVLVLVDGRGVRTLRGLSGRIEAPVLSPDDSHVAALSQDWRVGIWERATGRLKLILDVSPGQYQDNAGLAFSPDNRLIAFSSDRWAGLWEIESGRLLKSWPLPVGLQDKLSFQGQDHLILARAESIDPSVAPYGGTDPVKYPRYCAIYDLLTKDSREPKRKIREPNLGIQSVTLVPGVSAVVIDGVRGTPDRQERSIALFDLPTGSKRWDLPMRADEYWESSIAVDPTGTFMKARQTKNAAVLIDVPSGRSQDFDPTYTDLGPGARLVGGGSNGPVLDLLVERGREPPLLAIDAKTTPIGLGRFTKNGLFVVGASPLGDSVTVCDLAEIQRRLTRIGLGW